MRGRHTSGETDSRKSGGKNENNKTKWQIFIVNGAETSIPAFRLW
jgi:hypothetical protein